MIMISVICSVVLNYSFFALLSLMTNFSTLIIFLEKNILTTTNLSKCTIKNIS